MNPFRRRIQTAMQSGGGAAAFSPTDIAGLQLWLDASQIVGLNDGDSVATWSDLSGNANDFVQATGTSRPTYKTGIQNGLPAVQGDGVDDRLYCSTLVVSHPFTLFAVVKQNNTNAAYVTDGDSGGARRNVLAFTVNADGSGKAGISNGALLESAGSEVGAFKTLAWVQNGATSKLFINAVEKISGNSGSASINGFTLFNRHALNYPLNGYIAEMFLYGGVVADADRIRAQSHLSSKWGT